jgi:hypothetical protein
MLKGHQMNKTIIVNTTPPLFVTEAVQSIPKETSRIKDSRFLVLQGCYTGPRRDVHHKNLVSIFLTEREVKELKDELLVAKLLKGNLQNKETKFISMPRYNLVFSQTRVDLVITNKPGKPSITLQNLVESDEVKIDQKWFLDGFIDRFSSCLESFLQKEALDKHDLHHSIFDERINLYRSDFVGMYYIQHAQFHLTMETNGGISYRIYNNQGTAAFAIRNESELKEIETLTKEVENSSNGFNFAGVLNTNPKSMMTAFQSVDLDRKVFNEDSRYFIIAQTSVTMMRRIKFHPHSELVKLFKTIFNDIKQDIRERYVINTDGEFERVGDRVSGGPNRHSKF